MKETTTVEDLVEAMGEKDKTIAILLETNQRVAQRLQHLETEVKQLEERWRQHLETEIREDNPADARQLSIPGMEEHETEFRNLKEELRSVQAELESAVIAE